ncbi:MAG TPA: EamA family transporter [Candidatus Saccharimonadales bacterium]|nr:EamA family transporter [Candidatus Saccharimonadales bacterium]
MNWLWLALIAPAIYTVVMFLDKYVVEHKVSDYRGVPIYGAITAAVAGTVIWLGSGQPSVAPATAFLILTAGFITLWAYVIYFHAIAKSEASYIIAMLQLVPVFVLPLSYILLGEVLSLWKIVGFLLVVVSALALSVGKPSEKVRLNESFYLMLLTSLLIALSFIVIKFAFIGKNDFVNVLIYESWGVATGGLVAFLLLKKVRRAFLESFNNVGGSVLGIMFTNEILFLVSKAITFLAIALGSVAIVTALGSTQVFYGILYGVILSTAFPKIFSEETAASQVITKVSLAAIMFVGVWMVSV